MKIIYLLLLLSLSTPFLACKRGNDDPAFSLRSRKSRLTGVWKMVSIEFNGKITRPKDSSYYLSFYNDYSGQSLTIEAESDTFNFTWSFLDKNEKYRSKQLIVIINKYDLEQGAFEIQGLHNNKLSLIDNKEDSTGTPIPKILNFERVVK